MTFGPLLALLVIDCTADTFEIYVVNIDAGLLTSIRVSFFRFHVFILSWNLFMSMLGSQAGPPNLRTPVVHQETQQLPHLFDPNMFYV